MECRSCLRRRVVQPADRNFVLIPVYADDRLPEQIVILLTLHEIPPLLSYQLHYIRNQLQNQLHFLFLRYFLVQQKILQAMEQPAGNVLFRCFVCYPNDFR